MAANDETKLDPERRKALNLAISQIEKQLGKGSIMRLGTESPRERVVSIPTGAINLDPATGGGGRQPHGPPGPADEPGAPQAGGSDPQIELRGGVHQPAAGKDRSDVRQ